MKNLIILIGFITGLTLYGQDLQTETRAIEKAHETVSVAKKNFKKALGEAIKKKGPAGALGECKIMAPTLGLKNEQIELGRTSHKLRNQANKPREWVQPLLEEYKKSSVTDHAKNKLINFGPNHYGYVEPIYIEAVCLNCHGSDLKPEVRKELSELYPSDQATGFKLGDFRGLIWLESKAQ
ncbi:MAG: DUF3365 domain-containing protein [Proteobacteria bacterium]|nr:DUF3365 domain-containing protein [Pseudomonadota bacterium]